MAERADELAASGAEVKAELKARKRAHAHEPGDARHSVEQTVSSIVLVRGQRVMLSGDLAALYAIEPRALIQAVARNRSRFPDDFCFQLTRDEFVHLKSRTVMSSWGGARTPPYAFTEQGVAMLSSVLRSPRAIAVNIEIMRTFVRLRSMLEANHELAKRLSELEQKVDQQFSDVFEAIRELVTPPDAPAKKPIGFVPN